MLSKNTAISIKNVSKKFHKQNQKTFKELIPALIGGRKAIDSFWALKNVDFSINKGETFGVIGPNGSGKSTLLKLIAGVTQPTKGKIESVGKIAPLIELGAGFHPELTGRENVYLNGIILGMSRNEVNENFSKIVDFAEIWDFIDQPVKHYSSGMYLRLAFSVAVHTSPDILLIDEILAVGDSKFQKKCFKRMQEFKNQGVTIVYISHNLDSVINFCDRVLLLEYGKMKQLGAAQKIVEKYEK